MNTRPKIPVDNDRVDSYREMLAESELPVEWAKMSAYEESLYADGMTDAMERSVVIGEGEATIAGAISEKTYKELRKALSDGSVKRIRLNSFGGVAATGIAIYNLLKDRDLRIDVDGIAYSAASIIAMAGKPLYMKKGAMLGIHRPWGVQIGTAEEMRGHANALDVLSESMVEIYSSKIKHGQKKKLMSMYYDDTLISAKDAVEMGLADEREAKTSKQEAKAEAADVNDQEAVETTSTTEFNILLYKTNEGAAL